MTELRRMPGSEIKALPENNGRIRVGGHTVRFTDMSRPDLHKQFFNAQTDYGTEMGWSLVGKNILIEHGLDPAFKALTVGVFDLERIDDIGIYNEGWLRNKEDYRAMLSELNKNKSLGWDAATIDRKADIAYTAVKTFCELKPQWSSGALPQDVDVDEDTGYIKSWKRIEASMTLQPAEPNGTEIAAVRSAFQELKSLLSIQPDPHEDGSARDGGQARKDATDVEPLPPANGELDSANPANKENEMDDATIQRIVQMVLDGVAAMLNKPGEAEQMPPAADVIAAVQPVVAAADPNLKPDELAKSVADKALGFVQDHLKKQQAQLDTVQAHLKRTLPAIDNLPAAGNGRGNGHISGVKDLRTAHLTAAEMALGLMALRANAPKGMKFADTQFVSFEYLKAMQSKAETELERGVFKDERNTYALKSIMPAVKASELDASNIALQGDDWASDWWSSTIWEVARANRIYKEVLARGVREEVIPDGAETAQFTTESSDPVAYVRNQANSLDSTGRPQVTVNINPFATAKVSVTPNELSLASAFTTILQEDSIIPVVKQLNYQFNEKMEETIEQALINGDTTTTANTNINIIDGTPGTGLSKPYYLLTDGWLKHALVTYTAFSRNGGALDENDFRLTVKLLNRSIRNRKDRLIFIVDSDTYNTALDIVSIKTDEVRAKNSTLTSGSLEEIYGYRVVESAFMELANSSGKVTVAAGTLGRMLLVYPPYWGIAWKRRLTVENVYDPLSGTYVYVATLRMGMVARSNSAAAVSYNLTIA